MANSPKHSGRESREKLGFWRANRFLILRRVTQFSILTMFLSGPYLNFWILKGNYSGSLLFDTIPLTDPLIVTESLATGYLPGNSTIMEQLFVSIYAYLVAKFFVAGFVLLML